MKIDKIKDYAKTTALVLGFIAGWMLFMFIVIEFMWACYYAGIPL